MWHVPCHRHGRDSSEARDAGEGGGKEEGRIRAACLGREGRRGGRSLRLGDGDWGPPGSVQGTCPSFPLTWANWERKARLSNLPGWHGGDGDHRGKMPDPVQPCGPPLSSLPPPPPFLPGHSSEQERGWGVKIAQQQLLAPAGRGRAQLAAPPPASARPKIAGVGVTQPPRSHSQGPSWLLVVGLLRRHSLRSPPTPSAAPYPRHCGGSLGPPQFQGWLRSSAGGGGYL